MSPRPLYRAIALALSTPLLLAACGGGGSGVVRNSPPPATTPPPPPVTPPPTGTASSSPCAAPTGDCVLKQPPGIGNAYMYGGRSSDASLIKQDDWYVDMRDGTYRFSGGTRVEAGLLTVSESATLISNARVLPKATLEVTGTLRGGVAIEEGTAGTRGGRLYLAGTVVGNVASAGVLTVAIHDPAWYQQRPQARIAGALQLGAASTMQVFLPYLDYATPLTVDGRADIDGALTLLPYESYDPIGPSFPYPLPATPITAQILHAGGGVFGTFREWTSPGLFIEGSLRYGSNDVWFDLTRVSVQAAMTAQNAGALTLASAGNLDRVLAVADTKAASPSPLQARFLQSAGRLLWMDDAAQAARTLDSVAGSLHVDAMQSLAQDDALARGIGAHTIAIQAGTRAGAWTRRLGDDTQAGMDRWLSSRLLAGVTATNAYENHREGFGATAQASPQAAAYLRWFGNDGWYAGGSAGYAQHALALDRRIDLGDGLSWNAHSQHRVGIASLDLEAGRGFAVAGASVVPYAWMGADALRGERVLEQGSSGFELDLQAHSQTSLDAGLGLRVGKAWRFGQTGWLSLDADARYRQRLMQGGGAMRASFIGMPDVAFDLPGNAAGTGAWLDLGLRGGFRRDWTWSFGHAGSLAGGTADRRWRLGLERTF